MIVGILTVELFVGESGSLKEKRKHVKSLIARLQNRYNIAVAEVDRQDSWQRATLGVAAVGNHTAHVDRMLAEVVNYIAAQRGVEVVHYQTEII